jgi:hypothetical protein
MIDPWDLALAPVHVEDDPEPEPPSLHEHFTQDLAPSSRRNLPGGRSMAVERCRFDGLGNHTYEARDCPHARSQDEQGPIQPRGWTVQS